MTGDSGRGPQIGHVRSERPVTFKRNQRSNSPGIRSWRSVCLLDVDRFKQINDVHGHAAGDEALRKVAQVLTGSLRVSDIICRYGGDEFVIILPGLDAKSASSVLDRLRNTIQST